MFDGRYSLWGGEHSLFTRKLQAMLNYLDVDYEFCLKTEHARADVEGRLGTHFIPGLQTPEGWFIHDTTPIGPSTRSTSARSAGDNPSISLRI